jgi:hypothetical protein
MIRYLDCGLVAHGIVHIRCPECAQEFVLAFSSTTRELSPWRAAGIETDDPRCVMLSPKTRS